jgi:GAF domain-containing protein
MRLAVKLLLGWFAVFGLGIGLWQAVLPASFYADFPGMGHHWVSPDGPYNEHLLRDVGLGNLAVGTVALVALLSGGVWLARAVGLAVVVTNLPHQLYHQAHVSVLPTVTDQVLQSISLAAVSLAAVALVVLASRLPAAASTAAQSGSGAPAPTHL